MKGLCCCQHLDRWRCRSKRSNEAAYVPRNTIIIHEGALRAGVTGKCGGEEVRKVSAAVFQTVQPVEKRFLGAAGSRRR